MERLREALAWNDGDLDAYRAIADPALVFTTSGVSCPTIPSIAVTMAFARFWAPHESWEQLDIDVARLEELAVVPE